MAKNNKKSSFNHFFGAFDFNRDGKTDLLEQRIAHNIYKEVSNRENDVIYRRSLDASIDDYDAAFIEAEYGCQ